MKLLFVVPLLISVVFASDLGKVVDTKIGNSLPVGSQVVGKQQGQAQISQIVIPGKPVVIAREGPTHVTQKIIGETPAVSVYKNTHATQVNTQHSRTDTIHTRKETPVITYTKTEHLEPESHITQHHSSSRSTSLRAIPHTRSHTTIQRKSEIVTHVQPHHHDDHLDGGAIISHGGAGLAHGAGLGHSAGLAHGARIVHGAALGHGAGLGHSAGLAHGAGIVHGAALGHGAGLGHSAGIVHGAALGHSAGLAHGARLSHGAVIANHGISAAH